MIQREITYLKKAFMADSFSYKEFLSEYNYTNANDAISTLNSHFYCLKKLTKPKGISRWAEDRLQEIDRVMKSEEMISFFNDCRRREAMNQMQENSFLEEGVYLRTRKRTLEDLLNQTEARGSSRDQAAAATISSNNTQAAATTVSSISSSDQSAVISSNQSAASSNQSAASSNQSAASSSNQSAETNIVSSSNPDDTADIYNDISFLSNTTDDTDFTNNTSETENIHYKSYILCYDELTKSTAKKIARDQVEKFDADLFGFEDILEVSSIKYQESSSHIDHDLDDQLLPVLSAWLKACRKEIAFSPAVPYSLDVASHLFILHHNVIHQIPRLTDLAYHEEEFKSKHVYPLLCMVFSEMTLRCDIASNAYKHTDTNVFQTIRPDFLVLDNETELIAIEVKPFNTTQNLIEEDEVRVAELSKKMLHMRMARAKTVKEFCSFGICIAGDKMNLYKHEYHNGQYTYSKLDEITLPTMKHTYTHMLLSLAVLFGFKNLVLSTLPTQEEMKLPYLSNVFAIIKPTPLYLL